MRWRSTHSERPAGSRSLVIAVSVAAVVVLGFGIAIGARLGGDDDLVRLTPPIVHLPPASPRNRSGSDETRTRAGAIRAAGRSITAFDGGVLFDEARLLRVVARVVARDTRAQMLEAFLLASEQAKLKLGVDTVPRPLTIVRSVPIGYRIDTYTARTATIAIWYVGIIGSGATVEPQQSWRTQTVHLVWETNAWKVLAFDASPGPTPPLPTTETASQAGELFTAVSQFAELSDDH